MKQIKGLFEEIRGSTKHNTFKTYTDKRKLVIMTKKPIPSYTRTDEQDQQRTLFQNAITAWKNLSEEEKQEYAEQARPYALTGYQYFIKQYLLAPLPPGIWYKVTIDNTANPNNLVEYQIRIDISDDAQFFTDAENKREAIRLYDSDISTLLSYWIEEFDTTNHNAKIWVKVPSIPAGGTKTIYISIDPSRTEDASNGKDTFLVFIDADDTSNWNDADGIISTSDGRIKVYEADNSAHYATYDISISEQDIILESIVEMKDVPGADDYFGVALIQSPWADNRFTQMHAFSDGDEYVYVENKGERELYTGFAYDVKRLWVEVLRQSDNKADYYLYEGETLLGSATNKDYAWGSPTTLNQICVFTSSPRYTEAYLDYIRIRKYTATEPNISYKKA